MTPENNAAVALLHVLGPGAIDERHRARYFKEIGIQPPPQDGDYFVDVLQFHGLSAGGKNPWDDVPEEHREAADKLSREHWATMQQPWKPEQHPRIAAWLEGNRGAVDRLVQATRRPHYYDPFVVSKDVDWMFYASDSNIYDKNRRLWRLLKIRAMLHLGTGKVGEAREDLMAAHRLGWLMSLSIADVDLRHSAGLQNGLASLHTFLAHKGQLDIAQIETYRDELRKLRMRQDLVERVQLARCGLLESLWRSLDTLGEPSGKIENSMFQILVGSVQICEESHEAELDDLALKDKIDWNEAFRTINTSFDKWAAAAATADVWRRQEVFKQLYKDDENAGREALSCLEDKAAIEQGPEPRKALGHITGTLLSSGMFGGSSCRNIRGVFDHATLRHDMTDISLAVLQYRLEHGAYPSRLGELIPKYVREIPDDPWAPPGSPGKLRYRRTANGFVVYSIYEDGIDDNGQQLQPSGLGDLGIRIPFQPTEY